MDHNYFAQRHVTKMIFQNRLIRLNEHHDREHKAKITPILNNQAHNNRAHLYFQSP